MTAAGPGQPPRRPGRHRLRERHWIHDPHLGWLHIWEDPVTDPPRTFTQGDDSTYERIDPDGFDDCDQVDSTTVVDPGAPSDDPDGGEH